MKITTKTGLLLMVILVFVPTAVFFIWQGKGKKLPDIKKTPLIGIKNANNVCLTDSHKAKVEHIAVVEDHKNQLPVKDTISQAELPKPFDDQQIDLLINSAAAERIWKTQDEVMATWPDYSQVREQLLKELTAKTDITNLSDEKLVELAHNLLGNFWLAGGDLSRTAYRDAYMARILLEYGHQRNPDNLTITNELIEAIQAANLIVKLDKETNKTVPNGEIKKTLLDLRARQFEQIISQINSGRNPTMNDFLCGCDLAFLLQRNNTAAAKEVIQWLRDNASIGGWGRYSETMANFKNSLDKKYKFGFQVYLVPSNKYPDEYRYSRRLPTFLGPQQRNALLRGELAGDITEIVTYSENPGLK
ncbi:MAG: hypothetical protein NTW55_06105 [Planctomycetota bacterium]|nr:hypothetical protein [Planctomycetota bacterium]